MSTQKVRTDFIWKYNLGTIILLTIDIAAYWIYVGTNQTLESLSQIVHTQYLESDMKTEADAILTHL